MSSIAITAKKDFLQQLATATALRALAELIWNGFDAGANDVEVSFTVNELDGIQEIRVRDTGSGIFHGHVQNLFGNLGDSWKKKERRLDGRLLHGKRGQGRFKAFALGNTVEWQSCCRLEDGLYTYAITGHARALDQFEFSDAVPAEQTATGTEVIIRDISGSFGSLLADSAPVELAKLFGVYLSQYPELRLSYNGTTVTPILVQSQRDSHSLEAIPLPKGGTATASLTITEWNMPTKRAIFLCDRAGSLLHELDVGPHVRAPGYQFTVQINSDLFRDLNESNQLFLDELHPDVAAILSPARDWVKAHFKAKINEARGSRAEHWISEGVHPFAAQGDSAPERKLFEFLAGHLEDTSASLRTADQATRCLTYRLLGAAIQTAPESLEPLTGDLFPMTQKKQQELVRLLDTGE